MSECLRLKKSNCKNCYKCIRHCPVKAIRFSGNQAHIVGNECILCGQCFVVCPQNAKEIPSEIENVRVLIQSGSPVIATVAPSFAANYSGVGIEALRDALKKLGFFDVRETAYGATIVKNEYEKMIRSGQRDVLISSCCHSVNLLIQKHFPAAIPFLADVVSPMQAHCLAIKKEIPNAKTVFIGPCVAKKNEAQLYAGITDAVLTFEELTEWLKKENISLVKQRDFCEKSRARFFPTAGGILKTLSVQQPNFTYMAIDGVENCIAALKNIVTGKIHNCFIEMSACSGSCSGGPVMEKYNSRPINGYIEISNYAGCKDFETIPLDEILLRKDFPYIAQNQKEPTEEEITQILHKMGKLKPDDELNCGSCGYNSCREKAVAIFNDKAEISMCLPFLKERAESFSGHIINNTPQGIISLNESLEIQLINNAALKLFNLKNSSDLLGTQVKTVLSEEPFLRAISQKTKPTGRACISC